MRRHLARWIWIGMSAAAALAVVLSTEYRSVDDAAQATEQQSFDAADYGAETYKSKVVPELEKSAVELPTLLRALAQNESAAGEQYGHRQSSSGPYNFSVRGTGIAGPIESGLMMVKADGVPSDTRVSIQVGPAINGTALRDAVGFIRFGQFLNQVQYADAATALNNEMKKTLLARINPAALQGKRISFTGAFTALTTSTVTITPVRIEAVS